MGKDGKLEHEPGVGDARGVGQVEDDGGEDNIEGSRGYGEVRKGEESNKTEGGGGGAQIPQPQAGELSFYHISYLSFDLYMKLMIEGLVTLPPCNLSLYLTLKSAKTKPKTLSMNLTLYLQVGGKLYLCPLPGCQFSTNREGMDAGRFSQTKSFGYKPTSMHHCFVCFDQQSTNQGSNSLDRIAPHES